MTTYEIWEHDYLFEFAVRLEDSEVTGVTPTSLRFASDPDGRLLDLDYDASSTALYRFVECPEQFCQFEPWVEGGLVPVKTQSRSS